MEYVKIKFQVVKFITNLNMNVYNVMKIM